MDTFILFAAGLVAWLSLAFVLGVMVGRGIAAADRWDNRRS